MGICRYKIIWGGLMNRELRQRKPFECGTVNDAGSTQYLLKVETGHTMNYYLLTMNNRKYCHC